MSERCPRCGSEFRYASYGLPCDHPWHQPEHHEPDEERLFRALHKIYDKLDEILVVEKEIRDVLEPKANSLQVQFGGPMPLPIGSSSTATVTVLNQNGQPMAYDFVANPPAWTADANATINPGSNPNDEVFTGNSAGTVNWTVTVPGVANPMAQGSFEVPAAPDVATSVSVSFNPPVV